MKYPQKQEPFKSDTELMAWLFGLLAGAYSMLSQYEADERLRASERIEEAFMEEKSKK